jgi:hypothetical protein
VAVEIMGDLWLKIGVTHKLRSSNFHTCGLSIILVTAEKKWEKL